MPRLCFMLLKTNSNRFSQSTHFTKLSTTLQSTLHFIQNRIFTHYRLLLICSSILMYIYIHYNMYKCKLNWIVMPSFDLEEHVPTNCRLIRMKLQSAYELYLGHRTYFNKFCSLTFDHEAMISKKLFFIQNLVDVRRICSIQATYANVIDRVILH